MTDLVPDLKVAWRVLRRRIGFTTTVVVTLGLAIGANAAVFSVIDAVILHPLPIRAAEGVVAVFKETATSAYEPMSHASFTALRTHNRTFERLAAFVSKSVTLEEKGSAEELNAQFVTDHYFPIVGTHATSGRLIAPADSAVSGAEAVAVLSHAYWQRAFGADPGVVGRKLHIAGQQLTIIGVAARGFQGTNLASRPDLWIPLRMVPALELGGWSQLRLGDPNSEIKLFSVIGRLAPGVAASRATADLNGIEHARLTAMAGVTGEAVRKQGRLSMVPINDAAASVRDRTTLVAYLRLLVSVVAVTLLLACLNVANLMTVRSRERSVELGIRAALGATHRMLARQLLVESALLAVTGGMLGLLVAVLALKMFSAFALPGGIVIGNLRVGLDFRVVLLAAALTITSALAFGLYPAFAGSRGNVLDRFRASDVSARPKLAGRGALLAMQIAIALVLLTGATTFLESLRAGLNTSLGFDSGLIAAVSIKPKFDGSQEQNAMLFESVVREAARLPGVTAAAAASHVPLEGFRTLPFALGPATDKPPTDEQTVMLPMTSVTPDYFAVLGVPIVEGRGFQLSDGSQSKRVAIVNQSTARSLWPGESAIGKQFTFVNDVTYTVVGVVRDTKYSTLQDQGVKFVYAPLSQEDPRASVTFLVRSERSAVALTLLQRAIAEAAPQLTTVRPRRVRDQVNAVLLPQRFGATLLSAFALLAITLAAVGIHGTVTYSVSRRTRELGIRMALGGSRLHVIGTVMQDVGAAAGVGVLLGAASAGAAQQLMTHLLHGIGAPGVVTFAASAMMLCGIGAIASFIPARRAARIDPMTAMRPS